MKRISFWTVLSVFIVSCSTPKTDEVQEVKSLGFDISNMDQSIDPKQDFNNYVNGSWIKNNPVPSSETRWGSFNEVDERNQTFLKEILVNAARVTDAKKGSNIQKLGDFYATAMDSARLNSRGVEDVMPHAQTIDAISDYPSLFQTMGKLGKYGIRGIIGFYVTTDSKNSNQNICYASQSGLSLPDKAYYLTPGEPYDEWLEQYTAHVATMLGFLREENTEEKAKNIVVLEKMIAEITMDRAIARDPDTTYNKMSYADLKALNPMIDWDGFLSAAGGITFDSIIVSQPYFYKELGAIMNVTPINTWKSYLKWKLISSSAGYLSDEIAQESFNFFSGVLRGAKEQKPRWKRAIETTDRSLGEILGQEYVKVAFSQEAKDQVNEMVDMLTQAYEERIKQLDWMSEETKKKALEKLSSFQRKLAYPEVWKDMTALEVERDSYIKNIYRAREFWTNYMLSKLGKPVDRNEWGMTPSMVNAYYNPSKNEIAFPAGIMQPPFFDAKADAAVNFGGIGSVIGHELSHGFDDKGSKYDAHGNLNNWWTENDREKFNGRTTLLGDQFNNFVVLDSVNVNGQLTMGENIADLGGMTMSYYAYQKYLEKYGRDTLEGFTPEQRFFIGWAQVWRMNFTDQELLRRINTDPHSPGMFRANAPLSNFRPFYEAWGVKEGDGMYRNDDVRVEIW